MQLLVMSLLNRCRVSLQMTHQEIHQNTDTFKPLPQQRLVGVKSPNESPAKWFAGLFVFPSNYTKENLYEHFSRRRISRHRYRDPDCCCDIRHPDHHMVPVCHNTKPHETLNRCMVYPIKNNKSIKSIHLGEIEQ